MIRPDVSPESPIEEQPVIGLIGMGAMGTMYAKYLSEAGWKKQVLSSSITLMRSLTIYEGYASAICQVNARL